MGCGSAKRKNLEKKRKEALEAMRRSKPYSLMWRTFDSPNPLGMAGTIVLMSPFDFVKHPALHIEVMGDCAFAAERIMSKHVSLKQVDIVDVKGIYLFIVGGGQNCFEINLQSMLANQFDGDLKNLQRIEGDQTRVVVHLRQSPQVPKFDPRCVFVESEKFPLLFCFGGEENPENIANQRTVERYNIHLDKWQFRPALPFSVKSPVPFTFKHVVYVTGNIFPKIMKYYIAKDSWTFFTVPGVTMTIPLDWGFAEVLEISENVVIFGGGLVGCYRIPLKERTMERCDFNFEKVHFGEYENLKRSRPASEGHSVTIISSVLNLYEIIDGNLAIARGKDWIERTSFSPPTYLFDFWCFK